MISKYNERITITLNKTLVKNLKRASKHSKLPFSKFVALVIQNGLSLTNTNYLEETPKSDLAEIIRIVKTPWLDED